MRKQFRVISFAILFVCVFTFDCTVADSSEGNRFIASENNTVLDTKTGLMWATKDNDMDSNWDSAKEFCEEYSEGGYNDWRLPTLKELETIFDPASSKKFKTPSQITLTGCCPWSSDTRRKRSRTIFFIVGEINTFSKKLSSGFRALPVRKAQ